VLEHPAQHFTESFRRAASSERVRASVVYWTENRDGQFDRGFGRQVTWDVDLLSGYPWQRPFGASLLRRMVNYFRLMRSLAPDVVICFGWGTVIARLTILWCAITRVPVLFYGDTSWQASSRGPRHWLRGLLLRTTFHFAAGALSSGTFNREFYIHQGMHPQRIVDSVYPIDVASYVAARERRRAVKGKMVIGFAGKLIARKGVDELLRALQLISDDDTWEARIIGDGEERERLGALSEALGIAARVDFRGFRNVSEMPSELAGCDIVVVPSVHDNRGMIAAEAMAAGAGVVVSSNTGVWGRGDLVDDGATGRVYRSGDHAELATIIRQLLGTPAALASLQEEGGKRAAQHGPDAFTRALERAAVAIGAHG
jgi:glycosyltransferase involved in cell wall biosynthesis